MSTANLESTSEAAILSRLIAPNVPGFPPEMARWFLSLSFDENDQQQMNDLANKARSGTLQEDERNALDRYERIGHFLAIVQSKARLSLKNSSPTQ